MQRNLRNDCLRIIGVIVRHGGHSQYCAGIHVLHDDRRAVLYGMLGQCGGKVFFYHRLDIGIQRQYQAVAVLGAGDILIGVGHIGAPCVFGGHHLAGRAAQGIIVICLQPVGAVVIGIYKAQHRGSHRPVGIMPGGIGQQRHAIYLVIQCKLVGGVGGFLIHTAFYHLIIALLIGGALQYKFPIHAQKLAHTVGKQCRLLIGNIRR